MKLFVVEDSTPMRCEIVMQLSQLPHVTVVGHAATPTAAVIGISATAPDAITLDLHLEDGSGLDVLAAVRSTHPGLIVIVLSNNAASPNRERCLAAGAHYVFDKSSEFGVAIAVCRRLARMHKTNAAGAS